MLDRDKVLNWWTGRISDPELAEWTGMAPRAVGIVLNLPYLRAGVVGGGRGSRHTRRIHPKTRNAIPIIHTLNESGLTFELAANIINATPFLASLPTEVVDFTGIFSGVRSLYQVDPDGGWLVTDIVPANIWNRFVMPCIDAAMQNPGFGDICQIPIEHFQPNERGTMVVDRSAEGRSPLELKPLTDGPVYSGEVDPIGLYAYENWNAEALARYDEHLLIVDSKWVFIKSPEPSPLESMQRLMSGEFNKGRPLDFRVEPISVIEPDKKTVRVIGRGRDEEEEARAQYHLKNYSSLLDVNLTLAVRKMKRRAYGLPVGQPANPIPWEERVKIAQRYPAPKPMVIDAESGGSQTSRGTAASPTDA